MTPGWVSAKHLPGIRGKSKSILTTSKCPAFTCAGDQPWAEEDTVKKVLFTLLLFSISCTAILDEVIRDKLIDELEEDEEEEIEYCYDEYLSLPQTGEYPEELITPEDEKWRCSDGSRFQFFADGTFFLEPSASDRREFREYWEACDVPYDRFGVEGEWIIRRSNHLCYQFYDYTPGLFICRRADIRGNSLTLAGRTTVSGGDRTDTVQDRTLFCNLR